MISQHICRQMSSQGTRAQPQVEANTAYGNHAHILHCIMPLPRYQQDKCSFHLEATRLAVNLPSLPVFLTLMIGNVDEGVHGQRPHTMSYLMIYHTTTSLPRPVSRELYAVNGAKWTSEESVAVERRRWTFLSRHSD